MVPIQCVMKQNKSFKMNKYKAKLNPNGTNATDKNYQPNMTGKLLCAIVKLFFKSSCNRSVLGWLISAQTVPNMPLT